MGRKIYERGKFIKVQFPRINKNSTLEENREMIAEESRVTLAFVEKEVTLSKAEYREFTQNLLNNVDFLGEGGTDSTFDIPEDMGWSELYADKEKLKAWRAGSFDLVTIVTDGDNRIVVDAQGYKYARYVGDYLFAVANPFHAKVYSSHGNLTIGRVSGDVLDKFIQSEEENPFPMHKFDLEEWKNHYKEEVPESFDILDLGFWYGDDEYESPEPFHRKLVAEEQTAMIGKA